MPQSLAGNFTQTRRGIRKRLLVALGIALLGIGGPALFVQYRLSHEEARCSRYDVWIDASAQRYGVDSLLVKALIWRESNFNAKAYGKHGDIGLMQIVRSAAVTDWARVNKQPIPSEVALFDPAFNIEIGTWYLSRQIARFSTDPNRLALSLCAYNAGPTITQRWFAPEKGYVGTHDPIPYIRYPATQKYVLAILAQYEKYQIKAHRPKIISSSNLGNAL